MVIDRSIGGGGGLMYVRRSHSYGSEVGLRFGVDAVVAISLRPLGSSF